MGFVCRLWPVHDEFALSGEVSEGVQWLDEMLTKGQHVEVGEPFALTAFGDSRSWIDRPFPKTRELKPYRSRKPKPPQPRIMQPRVSGIPCTTRPKEDVELDCRFCGGKHFPTSSDTIQCMGMYWGLYYINGQKAPTQEAVRQALERNGMKGG